jgi:hypothetical protein
MPAADSRPTIKMDCSTLSHDALTCDGSAEVSATAFAAQPPDLPPLCLVDMGFAVVCQLAPHRRPPPPVLVHRLALLIHASFTPRLATTPLRFSSPSPPPGWAADFHPQAVEHVRHTRQNPRPRSAGLKIMAGILLHDGHLPIHGCTWRSRDRVEMERHAVKLTDYRVPVNRTPTASSQSLPRRLSAQPCD